MSQMHVILYFLHSTSVLSFHTDVVLTLYNMVKVKIRPGLLCNCVPLNWLFLDVVILHTQKFKTWWRHQMETFSGLLALCAVNSPVTGEFPAQRPVMRSFDVVFDLRLNKRFSKQSSGWWFETPSRPLWRHSNEYHGCLCNIWTFVVHNG